MLSLFPELLFLSSFAATLIRIALAVFLAYEAWNGMAHASVPARAFAAAKILIAAALFVGAWTQLAALGATIIFTLSLFVPRMRTSPLSATLLALAMALSLIVTGAGAVAFDLPL